MEKVIHHIRKVRHQPYHVKKHILHVSISICAFLLVALWFYSLGTTLTNERTQARMGDDLKPFSALKDNIVSGYNDLSQPNNN